MPETGRIQGETPRREGAGRGWVIAGELGVLALQGGADRLPGARSPPRGALRSSVDAPTGGRRPARDSPRRAAAPPSFCVQSTTSPPAALVPGRYTAAAVRSARWNPPSHTNPTALLFLPY